MSGTARPRRGDRTQLPGPYAYAYYSYQGETVDISRQNLSLLVGVGDLISTTQDLTTFFSALNGGRLLPAAPSTSTTAARPMATAR
ncbi:hypothetical protein SMD20_44045 [Nonomuraea sp. LP-02]|uniref:hypothetical protein n=1 Tax=Nonomuraea sp. LP-02 TaxID=3097960 RepID=UPI002E328C8D|nr:hypothetical protein [Nonomuraea sp. LP-02]MED7931257.1 hypothetical protein [Nonomuraea sp. LP-02]